jgi:hypothetical protein
MLNLVSFVVVAGGVFVLPLLGVSNDALPRDALGLGVLILTFYPFALLGHYRLLRVPSEKFDDPDTHERGWLTVRELVICAAAALAVIAYIIVAAT